MNNVEQRVVIKFLWLKGWGNRRIHQELTAVLHYNSLSITQVKEWLRKFKSGHFSCEDEDRPGRPLSVVGLSLHKFLSRHPFTSAKVLAAQFQMHPTTIKEVLNRELGLRRFSRRWVPHLLTPQQKEMRVEKARTLLSLLEGKVETNFRGIATGDESWFQYSYQSDHMYCPTFDDVVPRFSQDIGTKKIMVTIFFTSERLLVNQVLPSGRKFNQDYFIEAILPSLYREKTNYERRKDLQTFCVHMDNSMCHNGQKVKHEMAKKHIFRADHPPYSPDLSPCDFWLFGMLKTRMQDREFTSPQSILSEITSIWNGLTFDEIQSVFRDWMERLTWVIEHDGEYIIK